MVLGDGALAVLVVASLGDHERPVAGATVGGPFIAPGDDDLIDVAVTARLIAREVLEPVAKHGQHRGGLCRRTRRELPGWGSRMLEGDVVERRADGDRELETGAALCSGRQLTTAVVHRDRKLTAVNRRTAGHAPAAPPVSV